MTAVVFFAGASMTLLHLHMRRGGMRGDALRGQRCSGEVAERRASGRSRKKMRSGVCVVCVAKTSGYLKSIPRLVWSSDKVLEVGRLDGSSSEALSRQAATVIVCDMLRKTSRHRKKISRPVQPGPPCATGDTCDVGWLRSVLPDADAIYVDLAVVTGNDLLFTGISLVSQIAAAFADSCRTIVVKSRVLSLFCSRCLDGGAALPAPSAVLSLGGGGGRVSSNSSIFATVGVHMYREAALTVLTRMGIADPRVLEIGCHVGQTIALLERHQREVAGGGGWFCGVDIGAAIIQQARSRNKGGSVQFEVADAWDMLVLQALAGKEGVHVVCVDVGGLSGSDGLLDAVALLERLACVFRPTLRALVIKSKCVRDFAKTHFAGYKVLNTISGAGSCALVLPSSDGEPC